MKKKILVSLFMVMFILSLTACSTLKNSVVIKDDTKVLATVGDKKITQKMVDVARTSSTFTEKQALEKLIDEQLLMIKAKELKISVSDKDAKAEAEKQKNLLQETLQKAANKEEVKATMDNIIKKLGIPEKEYWSSYAVQAYKNILTSAKTREKLGADTDKVLKELREKVKVTYLK